MQGAPNPYGQVSWLDTRTSRRARGAFDAIIASGRRPLSLQDGRQVRQVWALCVSTNYLATLGVRPSIGRVFTGADRLWRICRSIVSDRFWKSSSTAATASPAGHSR